MIIKVVRGGFFGGVIDYVTRRGKYAPQSDGQESDARVLEAPGLFDHRTFAAQLAYDAARDAKRTRPVVHLIARAERSLTDAQYAELGDRMLKIAGLAGRAHIKVVHDEPDDHQDHGHLHLVACEVDEEGKVPARLLWDKINRREVTAEAARNLPKRSVESRAWDSQLAWKLTELARTVEVEWGLRQLSSKRAARNPDEPEIGRAQQEHLGRTGMTPLQDRLFHEVRNALALPTWDERAAALAAHALVLRPYDVKGKVRGLIVQSINNSKDAVKVSAFGLGGMAKLDAGADMPFLTWHPEYKAAVNLRKTDVEAQNDHWRATQRQFYLHLQEWRIAQNRRDSAYRQHKRARAAVMAQFEQRIAAEPSKILHRQIRSERSDALARINADRDFALMEAGRKAPRPTFADFVARQAAQGDASAAEVHKDLLAKVSQTRRDAVDRHKGQITQLSEAVKALRTEFTRLRAQVAHISAGIRGSIEPAVQQAARMQAVILERSRRSAIELAAKAYSLAERLVYRLDQAGHRIRITDGRVSIDRFQPDKDAQALVDSPAHQLIFQTAADRQNVEISLLGDGVGADAAFSLHDGKPAIDAAALTADLHKYLRWQGEPEVQAVLAHLGRQDEQEAERAGAERASAERQRKIAEQSRGMSDALGSYRRAREEADTRAADRRAKLVEAAQAQPNDSRATRIYLSAWQSALQALPAGQVVDAESIVEIEIGAIAVLVKNEAGYAENLIKEVIARRSPSMAIAQPGGNHTDSADALFRTALHRPEISRQVDQNRIKAADDKEQQDRADVIMRMEQAVRDGHKGDQLWMDRYETMLSERPIDTGMDRDELYGAIDHEVTTDLLRRGIPWKDVHDSLARLSPLAPSGSAKSKTSRSMNNAEGRSRHRAFMQYVETTLAESVDGLPAVTRQKLEAERQEAMRQARRSLSGWRSNEEDGAHGMMPPDALPNAPRDMPPYFEALDARQKAMLELAPAPVTSVHGASTFFDRDGRPVAALRELLEDVRENRADYSVGEDGKLTAPASEAIDQENLRRIQQDANISKLLRQTFEKTAHRSIRAHGIGPSEGAER